MFYDDQPFGIYVLDPRHDGGNACNARVLSQCAILVNAAIRSRLCAISMRFDAFPCFPRIGCISSLRHLSAETASCQSGGRWAQPPQQVCTIFACKHLPIRISMRCPMRCSMQNNRVESNVQVSSRECVGHALLRAMCRFPPRWRSRVLSQFKQRPWVSAAKASL